MDASTTSSGQGLEPAAAKAALVCPSCGANLLGNTTAPGERTTCLNCNVRFVVPGAEPVASSPAGKSALPKSPGYWLLRLAFLFVALLASTGMTLLYVSHLQRGGRVVDLAMPVCLSVSLGGWMLFRGALALARIDSTGVTIAWRAGLLPNGLPVETGSSLKYILPLAVCGGLLPLTTLISGTASLPVIMWSVGTGIVLLLLGLALDDVRQFIARQQALASVLARRQGATTPPTRITISPTGICAAGAMAGCGGINLAIGSPTQPLWHLIGFSLIGLAFPAYSLGRQWDTAIASWRLAAQEQNLFKLRYPRRVVVLAAIPALWALTIVGLTLAARDYTGRFGQSDLERLSAFVGIGGVMASLGLFMARAFQWRSYQEHVMVSLQPHAATLKSWREAMPGLLFWIAAGLAFLAVFLQFEQRTTPTRWNTMSTRDMFEMLTRLIGTHYVVLWLAAAPLQFFMLERALPEPAE